MSHELRPSDAVSSGAPAAIGPSRVWLVDDHGLMLAGLRAAIGRSDIEVAGPSELGQAVVVAEAALFEPHLTLLDVQLGEHRASGLDLVAPLAALGRQVVLFTGVTDRLVLAAGLEAGAAGIIGKHERLEDIVGRIEASLDGFAVTSPAERSRLLEELRRHRDSVREQLRPFESLTPRERLVLHDMVNGMSAEEMAEAHVLSLATLRSQIRAVLRKLSVRSQLAAVACATRAGWKLDGIDPHSSHQRI
jgi:two-component system nitrate/nitrite response regulator NarL